MLKPVHIIHLLVYSPTYDDPRLGSVPIVGRTRLMKMLFLFEKEISKDFYQNQKVKFDFDFQAYNYGPFSRKVYEAIDFLESRGIIDIKFSNSVDESDFTLENLINSSDEESEKDNNDVPEESIGVEQFEITKIGKIFMEDQTKNFAWVNLNNNQKEIIKKFKSQMASARLKDILRYVYQKYPDFADKSIIRQTLFIE